MGQLTQTTFQVQKILDKADDAISVSAGTVNIVADAYYGDGSHLTGIATSATLQDAYDENPDYPTIVTSEAGGLMIQNGSGVADSSAYILAGFDSTGAIKTTITASGRVVASEYYGDGSNLTGIETGGFQVVNVSGDTLCENNTIYFVDTVPGGVQVVMTLPQATAENFQVRIYKYSAIDSKDVFITSVSEINDLTFQIVQGEDEGIWIVSDGTDYHIVEDNRGLVQCKLARTSGAITPCTVTKNIDNTINLGAFIYFIEDASDLKAPVSKAIKFSGVSNYALTNLGTCGTTIIYIDSNQNLTQLTNVVTPDTYWSNPIRVAIAVHTQGNGTVDFVFPFLMPAQNPGARLSVFQTAVGVVKTGIGLSCTPASLQLVTGSGIMHIPGVQSVSYPLSPDSSEIAAHNPLTTISYYTRSSRLANKTLFDPTSYNSTGTTITTIPSNNNAVIHHVYCDILGQISVQYGQTVYASLTAAISAHLEGQDSFIENPIFNSLAVKIGYIIATKACTSLTDSASSKIIGTDKFGSTGGGQASASVVDLQRAYDNSVQPQITTSTTKGALQIKNGALANTTDSFEIQNISGIKVFGVNGLGLTTDSVSATTYSGITVAMIPTLQSTLDLKSTKITYDNTPWVGSATTFTLSPIKRYDFQTTACTTSVVWTLSPMTDVTEDCEYWFKLVIGTGGTTHTFAGCTFGINNDPVVAGATYEFHIKKTIVFIRRTA